MRSCQNLAAFNHATHRIADKSGSRDGYVGIRKEYRLEQPGLIVVPYKDRRLYEYYKDIRPITYLKSKAPDLLKQINETHRPIVYYAERRTRAVLQDPVSYENMRNAIGLLKLISQGEQDVKDGKVKPQEAVFAHIEKLLKERAK